jgi:RimJ/RimL family protein N-acetyltransferase
MGWVDAVQATLLEDDWRASRAADDGDRIDRLRPARQGDPVTFDQISWPRRTDRLAIRPAETRDLPAVFTVRSRPEVAEWMPDLPTSYDDWLLRLGRTGVVDRMLVMELAGSVIGDLYLHVQDGWAQVEVAEAGKGAQAEIGWCLSPDHRGKGYVTEATTELVRLSFEDLGVHRVVANAFADNGPSLRVMERLGMVCEGRFRSESLHRHRGWVDGVTYALLREDWKG